jgi:dTDP-4-dehydrorhamnose 3,5-epimerase
VGVSFRKTLIDGVLICDLDVYEDNRGYFLETFNLEKYACGGIHGPFVQDNYSHSLRGVLRGLHYQFPRAQAKLVSCIQGTIFDVAVDIRQGSPTLGKWVGTVLSDENRRQLFIPEGFAHGFCVLSGCADVVYKCSDFYYPEDDCGILWSDTTLNIDWPVRNPVLSEKDSALPSLRHAAKARLPKYTA